jgi:hypothetical protein
LPSATVIRDREGKPIYNYFDGIPVGHIENDKMLIYNHLEITVEVHHTLEKDSRIVGFDVEAFTIEEGPERMNMKNKYHSKVQYLEEGKPVTFSYSISTKVNSHLTWFTRFDHYLKGGNEEIHLM